LRLELLEDRSVPSTVSNLSDSGPGSLRQAIIDTPAGGTVDFQPGLSGTITLAGTELVIDKGLTIAGPGAGVITVSGNHASRVFDIAATFTVAISGLTITNGFYAGGGIYNAGTLSLRDSTISSNSSNYQDGGGIYNDGTLTIISSSISGNKFVNNGGGIYNGGTLNVTNSSISGNTSFRYGGGIYNGGTLNVTNSSISGNTSGESGGGIANGQSYSPGGTVTITGSSISGNNATFDGAGIDTLGGTLNVTNSSISGNTSSEGNGGGIANGSFFSAGGTVTVTNSTISDNSGLGGGGIDNDNSGTITITNSTISGNSAVSQQGGGINNERAALAITNSTISGNSAVSDIGRGGGINNFLGTLTLDNSAVSGNSGLGGGGIYNDSGGTMTITNSVISRNTAGHGGGIENTNSMTITNSEVSSNTALVAGGGILNQDLGQLTITNCTISGNSATGTPDDYSTGGGIENAASITISGSIIRDNSAMGGVPVEGGGIFNNGPATITNSTISGNVAMGGPGEVFGGGIYNQDALVISDSTISNNSTTGGFSMGGGIFNAFGTLTATSCTVSRNSAEQGGGIDNTDIVAVTTSKNTLVAGNRATRWPDVSGSLMSQGHNLIGIGDGGSGYADSDLVGTSGNPIDPKLGPLQDNGGPTFTMALLPGSPAIDAGDNADAPPFDQRGPGFARIVNGRIDIGAFEVQVAVTVQCSVTTPVLWPPNHQLVNVGLHVDVQPADAAVQVQVYANDHADVSDAVDIAPGTLELRAERQGNGSGRVYLIVVTATSGGQTTFDVCTVVVPHDPSAGSIAGVKAEAAAAEAYYREFRTAPAGYALLSEGPMDAGRKGRPSVVASIGEVFRLAPVAFGSLPIALSQSPSFRTDPATDPTGWTPSADQTDQFFRLFGDSNGNGVIDAQDLYRFAPTFGKSAGDPGYLAYFDYYGNGRIDPADLAQLLIRLQKRE
jgi:hypothetical protein